MGRSSSGGALAYVSAIAHQQMRAYHRDTIEIHQGLFYSGQIDCTWLNGYLSFTQYGGVHVNSNGIVLAGSSERYVNQGSWYTMNAGFLTTPSFRLSGGSYSQSGGTNISTTFAIAAPGRADVEGGTLRTSTLTVSGIRTYSHPAGTYAVTASYRQSGGTTTAGEFLVADGANAFLNDGALHTSNFAVSGVATYIIPGAPNGGRRYAYSFFEQSGGRMVVEGQLSIGTLYWLQGGYLEADTIVLTGSMAVNSSAIVNSRWVAGGELGVSASCELGRLELWANGDSPTVSGLGFGEAATLRFRNSRNVNHWSPGAYLVVSGWDGSTNGGGANQLLVGNNRAGLAPTQLERIIFANPANLPDGNYSAQMLGTGEVVPDAPIEIPF